MGEWRIFEPFFSLYEFFLGRSMNIFLGLIGVHEFFSFKFPLREYFFFVLHLRLKVGALLGTRRSAIGQLFSMSQKSL